MGQLKTSRFLFSATDIYSMLGCQSEIDNSQFLREKCRFRGQLMLQTHKYHINITITGTCIRQPFTISYMLKFICMLNAKGSVENAYISLTEEERQHDLLYLKRINDGFINALDI
ncbi:hypothetical protein T12_11177 [Trichinella patagoniensis]|uniref:Uncharacterized protein n=1 Tax=Trichinella patagoniensis TaxID=990121 RepID=A0A0V0Z699_9BILA|nr:hypothetical protein T12_11177 [Trichinella patagoniensis]